MYRILSQNFAEENIPATPETIAGGIFFSLGSLQEFQIKKNVARLLSEESSKNSNDS
jgi:hypothetical protein